MERISKVRLKIDSIVEYLTPLLPFANCHMVDYITKDHWNSLVPPEIRDQVRNDGIDSAIKAFWNARYDLHKSDHGKFNSINSYVRNAHNHCALDKEIFISMDELKIKLKDLGCSPVDTLKIKEFMSDKKSHEVEIISSTVKSLFDWSNSSHVIDIGGGKGYLSSIFAMYYKTPILNVDCSRVNVTGAENRNKNIEKYWSGLLKNSEVIKFATNDNGNSTTESANSTNSGELNSMFYRHVVEFVTPFTDLKKIINDSFNNVSNVKLCLTGLHTCGSLGSTAVKLFMNSPSVSVICAVPCCYHLLSESELGENSDLNCNVNDAETSSFPLSNHLKGFTLGHNARMLASQSIDRITAFKDVPPISIFYRALLQTMLDKDAPVQGKIRKTRNRFSSFSEYVKFVTPSLSVEMQAHTLHEEYLERVESDNAYRKDYILLFYLLRSCLAPVIERLILLDRLAFLIENGYDGRDRGDAVLVQMFNPILSPRCNSLIAFKY